MWTWLGGLPVGFQIVLPFVGMIIILLIAIFGNAVVKFGKKSIKLGKTDSNNCSRCRQIVLIKTLKYKTDREMLQQSILRDQMNYAEQKIHEAFLGLCRSFRETLVSFRKPEKKIDTVLEQKEYIIYQESLGNALNLIQNELRRSFKENGFCEMGPVEYTQYCKEKTKALVTIGREYLMGRYLFENMIIPIHYRFEQLNVENIETMAFSIFDRAKEVSIDVNAKIKQLDIIFDAEMKELEQNG